MLTEASMSGNVSVPWFKLVAPCPPTELTASIPIYHYVCEWQAIEHSLSQPNSKFTTSLPKQRAKKEAARAIGAEVSQQCSPSLCPSQCAHTIPSTQQEPEQQRRFLVRHSSCSKWISQHLTERGHLAREGQALLKDKGSYLRPCQHKPTNRPRVKLDYLAKTL